MITRETYREYDAINYSTLSALSKSPLDVHKEKDFSDGLRNGDMLDILCFDGEDAFAEKYYVSDLDESDMPSDTIKEIIDRSGDLSDESFLDIAKQINYGQSWKEDTIIRKVLEGGIRYIDQLKSAGDRKIISFELYADMKKASSMLVESPLTKRFFEDAEFQKPMTADLHVSDDHPEVEFKSLLDIYKEEDSKVIVGDLKYTSSPLRMFEYEYLRWRYDLQAAIYSNVAAKSTPREVIFYNIVYSSFDNEVYPFKISKNTIARGEHGGFKPNGRFYKGYRELAKEYIWHKQNDKWDLPYEFYVNDGIEINPYSKLADNGSLIAQR